MGESLGPVETRPVVIASRVQQKDSFFRSRLFINSILLLVLVGLAGGAGIILIGRTQNDASVNNQSSQPAGSFKVQDIKLDDLVSSGSAALSTSQSLSVNGQLRANNSLVLAPQAAPTSGTSGQVYFDQSSSALNYYTGSKFVGVANNDQISALQTQLKSVQSNLPDPTIPDSVAVQTSNNNFSGVNTFSTTINGTNIRLTGSATIIGAASIQNGLTVSGPVNLGPTTISSLIVSSPIGVASGGTGVTSLTNNGIVIGQGSGPLATVSAGASGLCLISTVGAPSFQACPGGVGSGVNDLNGLNGSLSIANASGVGTTITIDNATTAAKGIASFNATNFSVSSGVVNTIQNLAVTSSPTFAGITLSSPLSVANGGTGANTVAANGVVVGNGTSALSGVTAGSAGLCLLSTAGSPTFNTCPGSGGVSTLNGLTGPLTINNASTGGSSITIDNATTATKGIASFNSTNFTASSGAINTIQNINTAAIPTFAGLTTTGAINGQTISAAANFTGSLTVATALNVNTITPSALLTVGASSQALTLQGNGSTKLTATASGIINSLVFAAPASTNKTITLPNATGTVAVSASGPIAIDASGNISCATCALSGSGVTSLNGLNGALTLNNSSGAGSSVTIDNATTAVKGIASFNSGNFSVTSGAVNTIQDINTSSAPTFNGLTVSTTINGQTISNAASFTGSVAVAGTLIANTITPTAAMTVGATGQILTLQGNSSTALSATNGASKTSLSFQSPTANVTYRLQTAVAGTYDVCTTVGNCVGAGGGVTTTGGTTGRIAKFSSGQTLADSLLSESGSVVTVNGSLAVNTITPTSTLTIGAIGQTLILQGDSSTKLTSTAGGITNSLLFSTPSGSNKSITLPNASGTVAVSASGPIAIDANGNVTCPTCVTSGGGGGGSAAVDSLNGLTGTLSVANATGSGATITIDNATTAAKGIASFNSTNFTVTSGAVNTIQSIATSSTPTFNALNLTTALTVGNGGTGATTAAGARTNLGAAASGTNSDITSLSGLTTALSVGQGGTGSTTAAGARTNLGAAASGANSDITSLSGLTTALSVAQGGTGAVTSQAALNNISQLTTNGDLSYFNGTNTTRLARGANGECLTSSTTSILWGTCGITAEADTLASVTGRGATTSSAVLLQGGATVRGLTVDTATATDDQLVLSVTTGGAVRFNGTLTSADLTANRTWSLPDASGTVCLQASSACGFAFSSGSGNYIQNQNASQQASSSYWISGIGRADTGLQAPSFDTATAGTLALGNSNASTIDIGSNAVAHVVRLGTGNAAQTVTIGSQGSGSSLTLNSDTGGIALNSYGGYAFNNTVNGSSQLLLNSNGSTEIRVAAAQDFRVNDNSGNNLFNITGLGLVSIPNTSALAVQGTTTLRGLTVDTVTSTDDKIIIAVTNAGVARFNGTITSADLTAARTWTLPDASGTFCLQNSASCGFAPSSGSANYIQNQNASQQSTSTFWISGTGRADTALQAPSLDTAIAGALSIGGTNATGISLAQSTTLAAGKSLRITGDTTANRPASPTEGMVFYDTTTKQLLTYANGKWQADREGNTKIVAPSAASQAQKDAADYVASGTGDQSTIQTALTAASGGIVYLMEGTYNLTGGVTIAANTTLAGAGNGTLLKMPNSTNGSFNAILSSAAGITIRDLRLDGNRAGQSSGGSNAISLSGGGSGSGASAVLGATIKNVQVLNWNGSGIGLSNSGQNIITDNVIQNNTSDGIILNGSSASFNTISRNRILANSNATGGGIEITNWVLGGPTNNTVSDNQFDSNTLYGILLYGGSTQSNLITGNTFTGSTTTSAIRFDGVGSPGASYNTVSGNSFVGNSQYGVEMVQNSTGNTVSSNSFVSNPWSAIRITSGSSNTISDNKITDSGGSTTNNAIYITAGNSNVVTANSIDDSSASSNNYAIFINSGLTGNFVASNYIASGQLNNGSASTIIAGQIDSSGNFAVQPAGTVELMKNTNITGTLGVSSLATFSGGLSVTSAGNLAYQRNTSDYNATGTQDNINFGTGALFRITSATALTINGIAGGNDGRIISLINASGSTVTLGYNASGTAANNIVTGTGANLPVMAGSSVQLTYDSASSVWRVIGTVASVGGGNNITQTPTSNTAGVAGANVITPTASGISGLTVNGTSGASAATALNVIQGQAASGIAINSSNNTATDAINITGTFTNILNAANLQISNAGNVLFGSGSAHTISVATPATGANGTNITIAAGNGSTVASAPSIVGQTISYVNNTNTVSATYPAGMQVGDIMVMTASHGYSVNAPSGWTQQDLQNGGSNIAGGLFTRTVTAGDIGSSQTLTFSGSYYGEVTIVAARNVSGIRHFVASRSATGTTSESIGPLNVTSGDLVIYEGGVRLSSSTVGITTGTTLAQRTTDTEAGAVAGYSTAASTGTLSQTFTVNSTPTGRYYTLMSLIPATVANSNGGNLLLNAGTASGTGTAGSVVVGSNLSATGTASFQNATNSASAFQVQNAAGTNVLKANTAAGSVNVGVTTYSQGALNVGYQPGGTYSYGFEPGTLAPLTTTGNWVVSSAIAHTGTYSVDTGYLPNNVAQDMTLTKTLSAPGVVSFWNWSGVNSTPNFIDSFQFYIDGVYQGDFLQKDATWHQQSYNVGSGTHTFTWRAFTSYLYGVGGARNFIDDITVTNAAAPAVSALFEGAVGIGQSSPAYMLDIGGTLGVANDATFSGNLTIGAAKSLNLTGGITSTRPASPTEGMLYYDTTTKQLLIYANGKWQSDRSTSTKIVAASNASQALKDGADYVATGTNDHTLINTALTAAAGGKVYLTEGTFNIAGTISIPNNTTLMGAGKGSTTIRLINSSGLGTNLIVNTTGGGSGTNVGLSDLTLDGNKANQAFNPYGVNFSGIGTGTGSSSVPGATVSNVNIINNNWTGFLLTSSSNSKVSNVSVQGSPTDGFSLSGSNNSYSNNNAQGNSGAGFGISSTDSTFTGNTSQGNSSYGFFNTGTNNTFTGNTANGNSNFGFYIWTTNNTLTGNSAKSNTGAGYYLRSNTGSTITGNTAVSNNGPGFYGTPMLNSTLTGNTSHSNTTYGLWFDSGSNDNVIANNVIYDNGAGGASPGLYMNGGSSNNITGNRISDTAGSGAAINITAGSNNNYLSNNYFSGTGANSITDAGTGTIYAGQRDGNGNYINNYNSSATFNTSTVSASLSLQGGLMNSQLTTPAQPTIANVGTAGSTTYSYTVSALDGTGETLPSTAGTTATGNATLTGGNYNRVTWAQVPGAIQYKVYRTVGGATQGLIGTITGGTTVTFNDTGIAASGSSSGSNTTGGATFAGALQGTSATFSTTLQANTSVLTPLLDRATAGTLSVGTSTATAITIAKTGVATTIAGSLTVSEAATFSMSITVNGHIIGGGTAPTIAAGAAACTTPTVSITGSDTAGTNTVTTGTSCATSGAGKLATITFGAAFGAAPRVTLTPGSSVAAGLTTYVDSATISTTAFDLGTVTIPADSTTYKWYYHAIQ